MLRTTLSFLLAALATAAQAETATLSVDVGGEIKPRPKWVDADGAEITGVSFAYTGYARNAQGDFLSGLKSVKLVDAPTATVSVFVTPPSACTIGAYAVPSSATMLSFIIPGDAFTVTGPLTMSLPAAETIYLSVRLASIPSDTSGAVSCAPGSMTYTY